MSKFKGGDTVVAIRSGQSKAIVPYKYVKGEQFSLTDYLASVGGYGYFGIKEGEGVVPEDDFELVSRKSEDRLFKVGDKVRVLDSNYSKMEVGETGVISKIYSNKSSVAVMSDVEEHAWTDWGFDPHQLELVSDFDTSQELSNNPQHYGGDWRTDDFIAEMKLPFREGNIVKYVVRHKKKNGLEDLKKARNYLDRLIEKWEE